ncbi:MAG: hypothetical protein ACTSSH_13440, partial [Candidatus Heimdallarchaeota archaeon]
TLPFESTIVGVSSICLCDSTLLFIYITDIFCQTNQKESKSKGGKINPNSLAKHKHLLSP